MNLYKVWQHPNCYLIVIWHCETLFSDVTLGEPFSVICNRTNTDRISLFSYADDFIYFLSENELLAVDIDKQRQIKIHFLATLQQAEEKVLELQVGTWQNIMVVVVQFAKAIHVYTTPKNFSVMKNLAPYQKIITNGASDKFMLFANKQKLYLITQGINKANAIELV